MRPPNPPFPLTRLASPEMAPKAVKMTSTCSFEGSLEWSMEGDAKLGSMVRDVVNRFGEGDGGLGVIEGELRDVLGLQWRGSLMLGFAVGSYW
ncbi:hypothetical protein V6N12_007817 [Hibiscus sabdariffa]|uniref:Uncharacterized protein n=1 Tax=Hibiscus sabdariffa TaxID=183260 RepID=A0ABR2F2Z3_9ROSI